MGHAKMHNIKREPQTGSLPASLTRISAPGTDGSATTRTSIVADDSRTGLATITQTIEDTIKQPATTFVTTSTQVIVVTDSAQLSSFQTSQTATSTDATSSSAKASSTLSETSTAAASSSSSDNLGTLIPAIVVPVAAILIISFGVFWFIMRRKHQRQLEEEPEFVMASKQEKPISRGNSKNSSTSSTRELVPLSKLEKEVAVTTTEVRGSSLDLFPPKYSATDIGLARPMTPPDKTGTSADSNGRRPVPNFSKARPSMSYRPSPHSPRSGGTNPPVVRGAPPPRLDNRGGPSPAVRNQTGQPPRLVQRENADGRTEARSPPRVAPGPLNTNLSGGNRAPPPRPLNPPTPTGAFNGGSSISRYSPIVKDNPNLETFAAADTAGQYGPPSPLLTSNQASKTGTSSPVDENVLSRENMRIARLANSSRLGSNHSPVEPNFPSHGNGGTRTLSPLSEQPTKNDGSALSPRSPPPLLRGELSPRPFVRGPDSSAGGSSTYPSPSIGAGTTPRVGGGSLAQGGHDTIGKASSTALQHRASVVSEISTDDGYVDMEFDAKSDVSSLDERERWEMESDRHEAASRLGTGYNGGGYDSTGMSPVDAPAATSSAGARTSKPNLRDRDSEGPFVLSRY